MARADYPGAALAAAEAADPSNALRVWMRSAPPQHHRQIRFNPIVIAPPNQVSRPQSLDLPHTTFAPDISPFCSETATVIVPRLCNEPGLNQLTPRQPHHQARQLHCFSLHVSTARPIRLRPSPALRDLQSAILTLCGLREPIQL
ncbi:hypothetical protein G7Z17_g12930 [Cylindrodendrum hubeiense]|uniref:Uncharacterized protein n=1 Tax=Cylindrodendrum hubeiense TaxID=595255 RepID=A0A9P5GY14_9HYPO|nr:hypothetical protein G7Z17_g12930 [Cylindrodendrum hubeiense]